MLRAEHVSKSFCVGRGRNTKIQAVLDVSLEINKGEHLGLVGESGCGKSTLARMLAGLIRPDGGTVLLDGQDIQKLPVKARKEFRRKVQIIFQNPQQAFHPRMKLYETLAEPIRLFHLVETREQERLMLEEAMERMGLTTDIFGRYPHEISGGQAQRIALLRSLMLEPKVLIADEPTSMLDVSVQAQILKLIRQTTEENEIALLLISHDMDVIRAMSDKVIFMHESALNLN
ncbi:MAG: ABC transporter ATP-binding protein [Lachnospiraceae bacterium]|jgi:ABC-type glutathione transport system ATPase component|nr:ABC transporter ATP-binding protein [Lachnospiraceae bacterium]